MESEHRVIFCNYCGAKCVTKTSRTLDNPGRVFWACPLERGGHGWMEWFDYSPSPQALQKVRWKDKISYLESNLCSVEHELKLLKLDYDCVIEENESLKGELAKEKLTTRCLKKLLKGILLFIILVAIFMAIRGSIDENKMVSLPP